MHTIKMNAVSTDKLKEAGRQFPFAMTVALNDVAFRGREAMQGHLRRVLNQPITFTVNGVLVNKARKGDPKAEVFLRKEVAKYLEAQIEGGRRDQKGLEVGLNASSKFTTPRSSSDFFFIPTKAYRTGKGGNITKARARRILQETKKADGKFFMMIDDSDGMPYVYEKIRGGRDLRLALVGVKTPTYRKRVQFIQTLQKTVESTFEDAIQKALDRVLPPSDK